MYISINTKTGEIEFITKQSTVRQDKGKNLLDFFDEYIAIDLETTGLDPKFDDIIEMAAIHIKDNSVISEFQTLVNPGYQIDEFITDLTGITNEMLEDAPRLPDVLPTFINFLNDHILVAHNANFDINFLYDNCITLLDKPLKNDFVDTMRLGRWLFKDFPNHKLDTMLECFGICKQVAHRAISDSYNAHYCYEYMKKYANENNINLSELKKKKSHSKVSDITATVTEFDEAHPFYSKEIVFTGTLEKMVRREAAQIVANLGGICADTVTKKTNYLVLGNLDYCNNIKDGKSRKLKRAEQLKLAGTDIEIISENVFYDMIADHIET